MSYNAKTISNSFTVNTLVDGKDGAVAFASPDKISIVCYSGGAVKTAKDVTVTFTLKVGGVAASVSGVNAGTAPTGVTVENVSGQYNQKKIKIATTATADGMAAGVTFTVTGTNSLGEVYQATVTVALIGSTQGQQGGQGEKGDIGRAYYYGGEFDASNATTMFMVNDVQVPYFSHGVNAATGLPNCHVFNYDTNGSYSMAQMWGISGSSFNNAPWEVVWNENKFLMAAALFTSFAQLGSSIFNADFMYSKYGIKNGTESTDYQDFGFANETLVTLGQSVRVASSEDVNSNVKYIMVLKKSEYTQVKFRAHVENASGQTGTKMFIKVVKEDGTQLYLSAGITNTAAPTSDSTIGISSDNATYSGKYYVLFYLENATKGNGYLDYLYYSQNSAHVFIPNLYFDLLLGEANFGGKKSHFAKDGSGWLANKNITWDENGNATFTGNITANNGMFQGVVNARAVYESLQEINASGTIINPDNGKFIVAYARQQATNVVYLPDIGDGNYNGLHLTLTGGFTDNIRSTMTRATIRVNPNDTGRRIYVHTPNSVDAVQIVGFTFEWNRIVHLYVLPTVGWVMEGDETGVSFIYP